MGAKAARDRAAAGWRIGCEIQEGSGAVDRSFMKITNRTIILAAQAHVAEVPIFFLNVCTGQFL